MKLNILQISVAYYPEISFGGILPVIKNFSKELQRRGHKVTIVTTSSREILQKQDIIKFKHEDIDIISFKTKFLKRYGFSYNLKTWLKENIHTFDIVHIHGIWNFPKIYASKYCSLNKIPYIISMHGMTNINAVNSKYTFFKKIYINIFQKKSLKNASCLHYATLGESQASFLKHFNNNKLIIHNPLEINNVKPIAKNINDHSYILFVGRLAKIKNLDNLILAFNKIYKLKNNLKLYIVGNDEDNLSAQLQKLDTTLNITFHGQLDTNQLAKMYSNALLTILPSFSENFGYSAAESLYYKTPTIVSDNVFINTIPSLRNYFIRCGLSHNSIMAKILEVIQNYDYHKNLASLGSIQIKKTLSSKTLCIQLEEAYLKSINK